MDVSSAFNRNDPFHLESQLTAAELQVMHLARDFATHTLQPNVLSAFREEHFDPSILKAMGDAALIGGGIGVDYGGPAMNAVQYGLVAREFERIDSGYRTVLSVTGGLVMQAIHAFGNDKQRRAYLPSLAKGECIGCFGLTEPGYGSDPGSMQTTATKTADGYCINGSKRWIGLAPQADLCVLWAKDESGVIRGFIIDDMQAAGLSVKAIEGKYSLRVVPSGQLEFSNVMLPDTALLANAEGLKSVFHCLNHARFSIAWGVLGAAEHCFEVALEHAKQRQTFGCLLAERQLIQQKLVDMLCDISFMLQGCLRVSRLIDEGKASPVLISMLKRDAVAKALTIARMARDILGGNGICDEHQVMRHVMNLESVNTYEGTQDIHTLIIGRAITGRSAF